MLSRSSQAERTTFSSHHSYPQQPPTATEIERSSYPAPVQASEPRSPQQQWSQAHQPQVPPSPPRKSIFDFVSPFDALTTAPPSGPSPSRKKPVPPMNPNPPPQPSSSNDESSISAEERRSRDAKRQSVENLLSEYSTQTQSLPSPPPFHAAVETRPLLPKPSGPRTESPRGSPKTRHRGAAQEPTASLSSNLGPGTQDQSLGSVRDRPRDGSPTPRSKRGQAPPPKKLVPPL